MSPRRKGKKKRAVIILLGVTTLAALLSLTGLFSRSRAISERIANSPQFADGEFTNPGGNYEISLGKTISATWQFVLKKDKLSKPEDSLPGQQVELSALNDPSHNQLQVAWLGHSSLMVNIDGHTLLADPVFEESVSFFGPTRYNGDVPVNPEDLPAIDVVLISHNHYDHLNEFSIRQLLNKAQLFIAPLGVGEILHGWGVPRDRIVELDWWEKHAVTESLAVVATPAQHFSGRGLTDRNRTLWTSYVVAAENHRVFYGGDSGYFEGFKRIGELYGPFDMTFLECGAYNEQWIEVHMLPEETVQAHIDLGGGVLHPIHWGTFDLALHSWYEPMKRLARAADSAQVRIATPVVGGITTYGENMNNHRWWEDAF